MNRATAFGRAIWVSRQNSFTALSYDIYRTKPEEVDLDAVTLAGQKKYTPFAPLPGTHMYTAFGHLAGYSSAYYTYLWDKVIAEDFFHQFNQANLLADPTAMRYRRTVLEPGGSTSANDLVRNFLGREHNMRRKPYSLRSPRGTSPTRPSATHSWVEDAAPFNIWADRDATAKLHGNFTVSQ